MTDTITGLVWQADGSGTRAACATDSTHLTCTQAEAATYCGGLSLGGFSDWRLPAEHELHTIVDYAQYNPPADTTAFPSTAAARYWTSSPYLLQSGDFWTIYFVDGESLPDFPANLANVRCVRGSRCYPTSRFVGPSGGGAGVVTDTLTTLTWLNTASATDMNWAAAQSYCSGLGGGYRLPTLKELESIVDLTVTPGVTINLTAFPNAPADIYWTSSLNAGSPGNVWVVDFNSGESTYLGESPYYRVRCVR